MNPSANIANVKERLSMGLQFGRTCKSPLSCSAETIFSTELHPPKPSLHVAMQKAVRFADESGQGELCHYQCW